MENKSENTIKPEVLGATSATESNSVLTEKKAGGSVKTINISEDQLIVTDETPGVFIQGVQYYDLKNIGYISYAGMANLVSFIKGTLEKGVEVRFVNVNDKVKAKIRAMGLEHILHCV